MVLENTRFKRTWPWWLLTLTGLNIIALVLSIILSWHSITGGTMVGCNGQSPCGQVLGSRWSMIAGIMPVSGLAVGVYLSILIAGFYLDSKVELSLRRLAWSVLLVFAGSIAGSAVWFTILQKWFIGSFCIYCMSMHTTGLLLSSLIVWRATREKIDVSNDNLNKDLKVNSNISTLATIRINPPLHILKLVFTGLIFTGLLATSQFFLVSSSASQYNESDVVIPEIDYHKVPILGSPEAPYKVTLLFDYQCSHCQKLHFMLEEAIRIYDNKLAFVLCPTPLNNSCNPYVPQSVEAFRNSCELAKIGMAVWLAKREAYPAFENWIFTYDSGNAWQPRSLQSVRDKAVELIGEAKFEATLTDVWIESYIQNSIRIFGQTIHSGKAGIPKLIYGSRYIIPEPYNVTDLITILQQSLGVPKP